VRHILEKKTFVASDLAHRTIDVTKAPGTTVLRKKAFFDQRYKNQKHQTFSSTAGKLALFPL